MPTTCHKTFAFLAGRRRLLVLLLPFLFLSAGIWSIQIPVTHAAAACTQRIITTQHVRLSTGDQLEARLYGTYDAHGSFCGQMSAEARLITSAHGRDGMLSVYLTNCHDNDLATNSVSIRVGGVHGQTPTVSTALIPNGCGYASAALNGSSKDQISLATHTDAINASGSPQWEQWQG
jgi:hypothetical protein